MKQRTGDRSLVALVSGNDDYGHFTLGEPPAGRILASDLAMCREDAQRKRRILFAGAEDRQGKRYG